MRRMLALLAAVGLVASLGPASVVAAPTTQPNSFHGNFDLLDYSGTQYLGHIVVDFGEVPDAKGNVGSLDVTWAAGGSISKSHGQLTGAEFGQQANDESNVGALRWGWVKGTLCDPGGTCNPFAMMAQETLSPTLPNFVGWSAPDSSECCGGAWYQVGRGAFVLNYLGPAGKVTTTMVGPTGTMQPGDLRTFSATVRGAADPSVNWRVVEPGGGTITQGGMYTAPATPGTYTVMATSLADVRASATASVTVVCGTPTAAPALGLNSKTTTGAKYEPPDGYAYFGFMYRLWEGDASWGDTRPFSARICDATTVELAGKTPTTLYVWNAWQLPDGTPQPFGTVLPDIERIHAALGPGVIPVLEWAANSSTDPSTTPYVGMTTKDIASGSLDDYIRQYAHDVKRYGQPLFIRLICAEFNGTWNPWCSPKANENLTTADFVNAWRRVVDIFREQGVTNVAWLWNLDTPQPPGSGYDWGWDPNWQAYYPGDAYVDWVGADVYPIAQPEWLDPVYSFATAHKKPLFIGEFGIHLSGTGWSDDDYAAWLNAVFAYFTSHPAIKGISYFNYKASPDPNWYDTSTHTYLYGGQVNYMPNVNNEDSRLIAGGLEIRDLYADQISNPRFVSTLVTGP